MIKPALLALDSVAFWRRYNDMPRAVPVDDRASVGAKSACAMVPLKPNELSRDAALASPPRGSASAGMRNDPDDAIDTRCAFNLRVRYPEFSPSQPFACPPAQLRVHGDDARQQRPREQRRQARGRGGRLQVTHVRLERSAQQRLPGQRARGGAHLSDRHLSRLAPFVYISSRRGTSIGSPSAVPVPCASRL